MIENSVVDRTRPLPEKARVHAVSDSPISNTFPVLRPLRPFRPLRPLRPFRPFRTLRSLGNRHQQTGLEYHEEVSSTTTASDGTLRMSIGLAPEIRLGRQTAIV